MDLCPQQARVRFSPREQQEDMIAMCKHYGHCREVSPPPQRAGGGRRHFNQCFLKDTCEATPARQSSCAPPKSLLRRNSPGHSLIDHFASKEREGTASQNGTERPGCTATAALQRRTAASWGGLQSYVPSSCPSQWHPTPASRAVTLLMHEQLRFLITAKCS